MVGQRIKITNAFNDYQDGQLPYEMVGKEFTITKVTEAGVWVFFEGFDTLVLDGEYEIVL